MIKLNLTGTVARVTVEQAFNWITCALKAMFRSPKVLACNALLYGSFTAGVQLGASVSPLLMLAWLLYFSVLGSVIINLHLSREDPALRPRVSHGFRSPHMRRLLRANLLLGLIVVIIAVATYFWCSETGMFSGENEVLLQRLKELVNAGQQGDLGSANDLAARLGVDPNVLARFVSSLLMLILVLMLIFTLVTFYFMLVPFFIVLSFTEVKLQHLNMYWLSFRALMKLANFLPYLAYGLAVAMISMFYLMFAATLTAVLGLPGPITLVVSCMLNAPLSVFVVYTLYFAYIDLFCDRSCKSAAGAVDEQMGSVQL